MLATETWWLSSSVDKPSQDRSNAAWPLCDQNQLSGTPLILDWKHTNKYSSRTWILSCLSVIFQFFRSKQQKNFILKTTEVLLHTFLTSTWMYMSQHFQPPQQPPLIMQAENAVRNTLPSLCYTDRTGRILCCYSTPASLLLLQYYSVSHQHRGKKTVMLWTHALTQD